jgi:GT2 family glycosyltransferase
MNGERPLSRSPAVSVCIPAYQAEDHLRETLEAVFTQTFEDMEIVVLDNNSSDGTREILECTRDDRLRVERNAQTLPMADNFNRAVELCRGELVKVLCADDLIYPRCVADQAEALIECRDVALVACQTDLIDETGQPLREATGLRRLGGKQAGRDVVRKIVHSGGNPIGPPAAVMFRREDFVAMGGFRGDLQYVFDLEMWTRLLQRGHFIGQACPNAAFRVSGGSATARTSARSQWSQQVAFTRRIADDEYWRIGWRDRVAGHVGAVTMQVRRTVLYAHGALRSLGSTTPANRAP